MFRICISTLLFSLVFTSAIFSQSSSELVQQGFTNYQNGDYKSAIDKFTKALETPDSEINREVMESSEKTYTDNNEKTDADVNNKTYTKTSKRTYTDASEKQYVDTQMKKYVSSPIEYQGDEPAKIYLYRGWTYFQTGNKEAALSDFDKAVSLDPGLSDVYFRRAILSYDVDSEIACPNLLKAIEHGHQSAKELYDLICE